MDRQELNVTGMADRPNSIFVAGTIFLLALHSLCSLTGARMKDTGLNFGTYLVGRFVGAAIASVLLVFVVFLVARLLGKGKTRAGKAALAFWTITVLFMLSLPRLVAVDNSIDQGVTPGSERVIDSERFGLLIWKAFIEHPGFGFVVPNPGPDFELSLDLQRQIETRLAPHPNTVGWIFRNVGRPESVMIQVSKGVRIDERDFRAFARDFQRGLSEEGYVSVPEKDTVVWNEAGGEFRSTAQDTTGFYFKTRCLSSPRRFAAHVVCVTTTSDRVEGLDFVVEGLALQR